jgi:hypothetical protein
MTALLAAAPLGMAVICLMGQVLCLAKVPATPVMMVGLPSALLLVAALLRNRFVHASLDGAPAVHPALVALFLVAGVVAGYVFLAGILPSPNAFHQDYDSVHHINSIRAMMDSLSMSPLDGSSYSTESDALVAVQPTGYYPSGWHVLCATVALATNVSVTSTINAVNLALMAMVYPLSMLFLLSTVFPGRTRVVALGAVAALTLTIFPWGICNWGPVYPNIAAFAMLPAICALFMRAFDQDESRRATVDHLVAWFLSTCGAVLLHPNVVFSMAVFLAPWIVARLGSSSLRVRIGSRVSIGPRVLAVAFAVFCVVAWIGATKIPAFAELVSYHWDSFAEGDGALTNVLHLSYMRGMWPAPDAEQLFPAALLLVGGVLLVSRRDTRWVVVPYAITAYMMYVACCSTDDAFRSVLIGYWYSDPYRIGSLATIFSVPLISYGLDAVAEGACRLVRLTPARLASASSGRGACRDRSLRAACALLSLARHATALATRRAAPGTPTKATPTAPTRTTRLSPTRRRTSWRASTAWWATSLSSTSPSTAASWGMASRDCAATTATTRATARAARPGRVA